MTNSLPSWRELAAQQVPPVDARDLNPQRRWLGYGRYWRWQIGGWLSLAISQLSLILIIQSNQQGSPELVMVPAMVGSGILWTHLLRGIIIGLRGRKLTWLGMFWRLLPWMILFATVWGASIAKLGFSLIANDFVMGPHGSGVSQMSQSQRYLTSSFAVANASLVMQTGWMTAYFMHHLLTAYQKARLEHLQLLASGREAELRHLRRQMDPHFLFNSLNTVRALISAENTEARHAVTHLSELLRNSLNHGDQALIPLQDELAAINSLFVIEQLRFGARLKFHQQIAEGLSHQLVPPFVFQTLVENAIKHGIATREQGGDVSLQLAIQEGFLICTVTNPGCLKDIASDGVGLRNLKARLEHQYHGQASFSIQQQAGEIVCAVVRLPLTSHN